MLFDPFKEQLDLPTLPINFGNDHRWQDQVVGQKDKALVAFEIDERNSAQLLRICFGSSYTRQSDQLVAAHPCSLVGFPVRLDPTVLEILFCANHKKCRDAVDSVESPEVVVGTIHG